MCDASCFTTGPEKNPTLTAMAIAVRAADHLADDLSTRPTLMALRHRMPGDSGKLGVLLVTTPTRSPLGADTWVHTQIIRTLDRATHDVHVACVVESDRSPTPAFEAIRDVPDVSVHPVDFGRERLDADERRQDPAPRPLR